MKIKELEEKSGLSRDTVRYYEKISLLKSPIRDMNGYREYSKEHLSDINFIKSCKRIGISLDGIKLALENMRERGQFCDGIKDDLQNKKIEIREEIKEKEKALKEIDKLLRSIS